MILEKTNTPLQYEEVPQPAYGANEILLKVRTLRSLLHGYISFEHSGGWSDIIEIKRSFQASIDHFILSVNRVASSNKFKKSKRTSIKY